MADLFTPLMLGGVTCPNRIQVSPMCQYSAVDGIAQDWHLIHLGGLMMSGAGLVVAEATGVEAAGRISHGCLVLETDEQEQALADLVARLRPLSDASIGIQLGHAGRRASARSIRDRGKGESLPPEEGAWQTYAPSALPYNDQWATPAEMTEDDIIRITRAFAQATRRAVRAGFDLVECHAAHGYLLHQFLSPRTNRRTDAWGGTLENRMRFPLAVVQAMRDALPADRALGVRVNSTDWHPQGATLDDSIPFVRALKDMGVDYVTLSAGNLVPDAVIPKATPGHQVGFAERIRQETGMTVVAVGMISDPVQADAVVREGRADMVAIGRAMLDNPRWGWHAAARLGRDVPYPPQYLRARPNNWTDFQRIHPGAQPIVSTQQADRPSGSTWDRPEADKLAAQPS
ncbi:NADH:flavin oxidoreductase/NADH oxidase [Pseudooceanicola nitratireducens]|uniref:NADH:flavin oxidoreductase/NADH oxidase n=1 Tax=Pseudooceanicola nitratireducens TaxID=517719 RepID=UPI001C97957F|nr:NADH:flavin oxidoreductase/NADH oxidase [Pseudooceanicola nitratireducens]MBY6166573.1 NADH:flavin oxidoreductase/NADH oxidase [Pseudooceanicola nitratireducens]